MQDGLRLEGVTRSFAGRRALDEVSLTARAGRVTGLLGRAGAGRTTALRVVVGVLAPDDGAVTLDGRPVTAVDRRSFGYLPQERGLYPRMAVLDQLVHLARVHGVRPGVARGRAEALLDRLGVAGHAGDRLQALAPGDQQRVQLAATLVHAPSLLVLDDPAAGLTAPAVDVMCALLREHAAQGEPVLLTTEDPGLVERICDDVVVLDRGRVVADGDVREVRRARTPRRLRLTVEPFPPAAEVEGAPSGVSSFLDQVPGVALHRQDGTGVVVDLADDADDQAVLAEAQRHGVVRRFEPVEPGLAEVLQEVWG